MLHRRQAILLAIAGAGEVVDRDLDDMLRGAMRDEDQLPVLLRECRAEVLGHVGMEDVDVRVRSFGPRVGQGDVDEERIDPKTTFGFGAGSGGMVHPAVIRRTPMADLGHYVSLPAMSESNCAAT